MGLFRFISDYLPYFENINILFNIITKKKFELIYKDWSKLFVRFIRNNLNQVEVISSWTKQKLRSILNCQKLKTIVLGFFLFLLLLYTSATWYTLFVPINFELASQSSLFEIGWPVRVFSPNFITRLQYTHKWLFHFNLQHYKTSKTSIKYIHHKTTVIYTYIYTIMPYHKFFIWWIFYLTFST